jgi:hypothetical protein
MSKNLEQVVFEHVYELLSPLMDATESDAALRALFRRIGWDVDAIFTDLEQLKKNLAEIGASREQLAALAATPPASLAELKTALASASQTLDLVRQASALLKSVKVKDYVADKVDTATVCEDLFKQLLAHQLRKRAPLAFNIIAALQLATDGALTAPVTDQAGNVIRLPYRPVDFHFERLPELLSAITERRLMEYLKKYWGPRWDEYAGNTFTTNAGAQKFSDLVFRVLAITASGFGFAYSSVGEEWHGDGMYGIQPAYGYTFDAATTQLLSRMLIARWTTDVNNASGNFIFVIDPKDTTNAGGNGLVFVPTGALSLQERWRNWDVTLQLQGVAGGVAWLPWKTFSLCDPKAGGDVRGQFGATRGTEQKPFLVLGGAKSTRLEIGQLQLAGDLALSASEQTGGLVLRALKSAAVLAPADGDGFLQTLLPPDGLKYEFDLGVGWSNKRGLYFERSGAMNATIPINKTILDVLTVESAYLSVKSEDTKLPIHIGTTLKAKLGPVTAVVDRVGLKLDLGFSDKLRGNLGPVNLGVEFRPPDGVGLTIDSGPVVGGGFISYDASNQQYAGALYLELNQNLTLSAIGLLTTRMPDNSKGYSLLVIVTAKGFPPVQLGGGFTLTAIGGLVGINRTGVVEEMRAGLKSHTLDALLFPVDPVKNATQYVSSLQRVFPPAPDRYILGLMATIGWGAPQTLVTFELALLLELPAPVRLIAVGRIKATFPRPDAALVVLQMDALGVIDFDRCEAALDATLHDSWLAGFTLTGDMALRANWGDAPDFALSLGGFHPQYAPPPNFPALERLALNLANEDDPRLHLDAYLALTTNTLQFGAHLDVYAAECGYELRGGFGFDTLLQFDPFSFSAAIKGYVNVRKDGELKTSAYLDCTLSGPAPWRAIGQASFVFCEVSFTADIDITVGSKQSLPPQPAVDLLGLLKNALEDPRSWSGQRTPAGQLVTLKTATGTTGLLVHPLGDLTLRQRIAPLKTNITQYGSAKLKATNYFALTPSVGSAKLTTAPVSDAFAPANYLTMTDSEKLSRPAFETMESGVNFMPTGASYATDFVERSITFETIVIDPAKSPYNKLQEAAVRASTFAAVVGQSAAAQAPAQNTGNARFRNAAESGSTVSEAKYLVAVVPDLIASTIGNIDPKIGVAYTKADEELRKHLAAYPDQQGRYQVMGIHEVT